MHLQNLFSESGIAAITALFVAFTGLLRALRGEADHSDNVERLNALEAKVGIEKKS